MRKGRGFQIWVGKVLLHSAVILLWFLATGFRNNTNKAFDKKEKDSEFNGRSRATNRQ